MRIDKELVLLQNRFTFDERKVTEPAHVFIKI